MSMAPSAQTYRSGSSKPTSRRPKLMRASATCPQLATSNASRKDLASLQSCGAATILTRVASYSTAQHEHDMRTPHSAYSSSGRSPESASSENRKEPFEVAIHQCKYRVNSHTSKERANGFQRGTTTAFLASRTS